MRKLVSRGIVVACGIVTLSVLPAAAQVAGPIEVFAHSFKTTVSHSDFGDVGCEVQNRTTDSAVGVLIEANVTYADGSQQKILGPTPTSLEPDSSTVLFIAFAIPASAANGTAVFECIARVNRITGGTNRGDYGGGSLVGVDTAPFDVVP